MDMMPVIRDFFGDRVRVFEMKIETEIDGHNLLFETYGIPLWEYARFLGRDKNTVKESIKRNSEIFRGFYCVKPIPDALGRIQQTIIMSIEMCWMLTIRMQTHRVKDPIRRAAIINFEHRLMSILPASLWGLAHRKIRRKNSLGFWARVKKFYAWIRGSV